jgi:hypothetical protein
LLGRGAGEIRPRVRETTKENHHHVREEERQYAFRGVNGLIEDFIVEVETWRSGH